MMSWERAAAPNGASQRPEGYGMRMASRVAGSSQEEGAAVSRNLGHLAVLGRVSLGPPVTGLAPYSLAAAARPPVPSEADVSPRRRGSSSQTRDIGIRGPARAAAGTRAV